MIQILFLHSTNSYGDMASTKKSSGAEDKTCNIVCLLVMAANELLETFEKSDLQIS